LSEFPLYMKAPLTALQFSSPDCSLLARLAERDWPRTLRFCDRAQLTLPLALQRREHLPEDVRARTDRNLAGNAERWQRIQSAYRQIAEPLQSAGIDAVVLKGFSHCPQFICNPRWRPQYDFDLLLPLDQLLRARDVARSLGYEPLRASNGRIDHLPTMIRKTGWQWRGDFFDPDIPLALELHFRLWDESTEQFSPSGLDQFWERRERRVLEGLSFTALHRVDAVAYASLHLLRHLLRGDGKPFHVYELASLLHRTAGCESCWSTWQEWHDPSLRQLEAICFDLAHRWFGCHLSQVALEEIEALPPEVNRWLELCAFSPLMHLVHPNKDELWLHWSLLDSRRKRGSMLYRRLLPPVPQGPVDAVHLPANKITWRIEVRRRWRYARYAASRVSHHLAALPGVAMGAIGWFAGLKTQYWTFFLTAAFFNFGLFIYFFLYNLYLLQLGFRENFLGLVSGIMTAGSVAGCIPAAAAVRRFGLRPTLFAAFLMIACISVLRAIVPSAPVLVALAFIGGLVQSTWGVAISPAVARLTTERNRSLGFSLIMSSGVGIGVLAGFIGGRMPGKFSQLLASNVDGYRAALLLGCAMVILALLPLSRLKIDAPPISEPAFRRPSPLLLRFFAAMVVWNLGTGAFNPFFSAFFVHLRFSTEHIGVLFSSVHLAQALAMLAAPIAIHRLGLARGISTLQLATALSLAGLAMWTGPTAASFAYGSYVVFQYMSEPGVFALLMNSVPLAQRAGVSALNMIVIFASQAAAAGLAGVLITRFGYPPVLTAASLTCVAAALLFRGLRAERIVPSDS
jgi:predicted MFS family arabinose efflux permease